MKKYKLRYIKVTCSNYDGEQKLQGRFIAALQGVIDDGGQIINITSDAVRHKAAYVQELIK